MSNPALSGGGRADQSNQSPVNNSFLNDFEFGALVGNTELDSNFLGALDLDGEFVSDWRHGIVF